jgi:hypothetical protein
MLPNWEEVMKYDWNEHAARKQASRDKDAEDIKNGVPVAEIRKKNFMFSGIDMSKVVVIAPDGTRFPRPKK